MYVCMYVHDFYIASRILSQRQVHATAPCLVSYVLSILDALLVWSFSTCAILVASFTLVLHFTSCYSPDSLFELAEILNAGTVGRE